MGSTRERFWTLAPFREIREWSFFRCIFPDSEYEIGSFASRHHGVDIITLGIDDFSGISEILVVCIPWSSTFGSDTKESHRHSECFEDGDGIIWFKCPISKSFYHSKFYGFTNIRMIPDIAFDIRKTAFRNRAWTYSFCSE